MAEKHMTAKELAEAILKHFPNATEWCASDDGSIWFDKGTGDSLGCIDPNGDVWKWIRHEPNHEYPHGKRELKQVAYLHADPT